MANVPLDVRTKFYADRPGLKKALGLWQWGILSRTGAYGRGVMKKQIRPALKGRKKDHIVPVMDMRTSSTGRPYGRVIECLVSNDQFVMDRKTGMPVRKEIADQARLIVRRRRTGKGVGSPPRSRTGKLRKNIDFGIVAEKNAEGLSNGTVIIGAIKFVWQPLMLNRASVPQLLDIGGKELVHGVWAKYGKRPFVRTVFKITKKKMAQFIKQRPIHK